MIIDGLHFVILVGGYGAANWMLGYAAGMRKGHALATDAAMSAVRDFIDRHIEEIALGKSLIETAQRRKLHAQFAPDGFTATGQMLATVDGQQVLITVKDAE